MPIELAFALGLIIGTAGTAIIAAMLRTREKADAGAVVDAECVQRNLENQRLAAANAALTQQMTEVRDRLATLERITTDKTARLADEIDALRI